MIGFNNLDFADYLGLTTIVEPLRESGRGAARLLLEHINNPTEPTQQIQRPVQLVQRPTA